MIFTVPTAVAQTAVAAVASPSPSPAPRFALSVHGSNVFIDRSAQGPGITPPEGSEFARGSPVSPMSPYDWFSSAPETPGVAGVAQYEFSGVYHATGLDFGATFGVGALAGSTTNALYWGEPLVPNLDVHALSRRVPYAIVFPTHAGQDDASLVAANLLQASAAAADGAWTVRGGYFDLNQTDRFVFAPPPLTSVAPSLGVQTAETLGPGVPSIAAWGSTPSSLPLLGADATVRDGRATLELTDALLPSPIDTNARLTMGSLVFDEGNGGRYSFQVAHVWTAGDPIATTTYYGVDRRIDAGYEGRLFTSTLANQTQTIAGARAFVHPAKNWDALLELGRAWYEAGPVALPGSGSYGDYEHLSVTRHFGSDAATLEYHRFDPTYATMILPYGIPENIWSVAWSWPGVWLKSTYQLVDNSTAGVNREGLHVKYDRTTSHFEVHAAYGDWRQIQPETIANASQTGFVDGFFLLQHDAFGTIGRDRQYALYVAWHFPHDDLALDAVRDDLDRPAAASQPIDTVAMRLPQLVASWTHRFSPAFLALGGYGRYEAIGEWATTPVDAIYGIGFAGVQFATGRTTALLVEGRHYGLTGVPSMPGGLPPTMTGNALIVDQRIAVDDR